MAINSADHTDAKLNFNLCYPAPPEKTTEYYAAQAGIDPAWVCGLVCQESCFAMGAQPSVGIQGPIQVMSATTRKTTGKTGMNNEELYATDDSIRMSTWYASDTGRRLQDSKMVATTGYSTGPAHACDRQAIVPLKSSIYAETIPFTETRGYAKKVMTNATCYASLFNERQTSLKQHMGTVPARYWSVSIT